MILLHSILDIPVDVLGICALSLNSILAYPVSSTNGKLLLFDAINYISINEIEAHNSPLSALDISPNGNLVATTSEKGTFVRVYFVPTCQRIHEFRRGVLQVNIASLKFSYCEYYLCVSSNTETVHVFKINQNEVENVRREFQNLENEKKSVKRGSGILKNRMDRNKNRESVWNINYFTKAVTSYLPAQLNDILSQDRAFATVQLGQSETRNVCAVTKLDKETKVLVAGDNGFLYIYDFDTVNGGICKLNQQYDLRSKTENTAGTIYIIFINNK